MSKQYYFTLRGSIKRARDEFNYYTRRPWSLSDVGNFWDTVEDYDDINEQIYPYFRRLTNSYELAEKYLPRDDYEMLDIQARSGKGSLYWHEKNKIKSSVCVDFSDYLASLAERRLKDTGLDYKSIMIKDFPIPFEDKKFNFVCSYETIEHVYDFDTFISELARVMTDDGVMIITCPNVMWEWVHWLTAIININHSEGPHRFLLRGTLLKTFKKHGLEILEENSTIMMPFNKKWSIYLDKLFERNFPFFMKSVLALRRTFVLKKVVKGSE